MSAATRAALATAVETVDGITCSPYFTQSTRPGQAYVRLDRVTYPNRLAGLATWQVVVALTGDLAQAEQRTDELVTELCDALEDEMTLTSITPQTLSLGSGSLPCVVVEGTREFESE